ncbi:MAG: hypothetical protein OQJ89_02470 [Kangiellaceae bacterium]|nr:hypothetical protein [Kangiellaceae bacterium]MCW9015810.1 hypothetical protein [Kangiellaceae bacterium]
MRLFLALSSLVLLTGCLSAVQKSYLDGADAFLAGNYELAKNKLQKCAASRFPQCNYILGNISLKQGRTSDAIAYLQKDAAKGHKESQGFLALAIYKAYLDAKTNNKTPGKEADLSEAIAWIWVARKQGLDDSSNLFSTLTFELADQLNTSPGLVPGLMVEKLEEFEMKYLP